MGKPSNYNFTWFLRAKRLNGSFHEGKIYVSLEIFNTQNSIPVPSDALPWRQKRETGRLLTITHFPINYVK